MSISKSSSLAAGAAAMLYLGHYNANAQQAFAPNEPEPSPTQPEQPTEPTIKKKGKCPFGFGSSDDGNNSTEVVQMVRNERPSNVIYPSQVYLNGIKKTQTMNIKTYEELVDETIKLYEAIDSHIGDNTNERASFVGCLVRQAGHDFMDYRPDDSNVGGSDGCSHYDDPDNMGLYECVTKFGIDKLYENWNTRVSIADFLVIIAEAVMGRVATDNYGTTYNKNTHFRDGTYAKTLRDSFKYGRKTQAKCEWNVGRMPNPENACEGKGPGKDGLKQIFVDNIYRDSENPWTMTAAISGAHTVGSAKKEMSGYDGFWSDKASSGIWNNNYYKSVLMKGWGVERAINGNKEKNQWKLIDKGLNEHKQMMLTTDMCLVYKNNERVFNCRKYGSKDKLGWEAGRHDCMSSMYGTGTDLDPRTANCCAWIKHVALRGFGTPHYELCGVKYNTANPKPHDNKRECCGGMHDDQIADCDMKYFSSGFAWEDYMDFAKDEDMWLRQFAKAWHMANENGMKLKSLDSNALQQMEELQMKKESTICTDMGNYRCTSRTNCKSVNMFELFPESTTGQYISSCINKHTPQSTQRKELSRLPNFGTQNTWNKNFDGQITAWTSKYRNLLQLKNPTASSTNGQMAPFKVLKRQVGWNTLHDLDYFQHNSKPYNWGVRSYYTKNPWTYSSVWQSEKSQTGPKWWKAQFADGEATILQVRVMYPKMNKNFMGNVKVYIGDQLCGKIDKSKYISIAAVIVKCDKLLTGDSVRVEMEDASQQLAISDVMVHSTLPRPEYLQTPSHTYATYCSQNNRQCDCTGIIYYGSGDTWWSRKVTDYIGCKAKFFPDQKNLKGTCKCFSTIREEFGETAERPYVFSQNEFNNQVNVSANITSTDVETNNYMI